MFYLCIFLIVKIDLRDQLLPFVGENMAITRKKSFISGIDRWYDHEDSTTFKYVIWYSLNYLNPYKNSNFVLFTTLPNLEFLAKIIIFWLDKN